MASALRFEQRTRVPWTLAVAAPVAAVAFALLACAGLVLWAGAPVGRAYALLLEGAAGSRFAITETLTRATPLIFTGLAAAVAFRAHFYNIGAEGQLYVGALAAVAVAGAGWSMPPGLLFPLMVVAGMVAGAALLLVPALAKTRLGV
ncbi:MAG: ABC transporter permease, partial [Burkholderiales bacterium]|nr:ABC transporter permease [Burkholderiales bacterium]